MFGAQAIACHEKDPTCNANITDLTPFLDVRKYPDKWSDLVSLIVREHQAHMQTLLTRMGYDVESALQAEKRLWAAYPAAEAALKYLLLVDEVRLKSPVKGTSDFARWFEQQGPKDK